MAEGARPRPAGCPEPHCCRCAAGGPRAASPLTCLAVCFLVLTYNLLGGFLFLAIEGSAPELAAPAGAVAASQPEPTRPRDAGADLRARTVDRLWSITEDLNILYKENWTELAAKELVDFQRVLIESMKSELRFGGRVSVDHDRDYRWTFSSSFLYALTLITTIGHGNVTPKSSVGKVVAIAYACVGIPIIMLYLSTIGEALARNFRVLYGRVRPASVRSECATREPDKGRTPFQAALNLDSLARRRAPCRAHARVPIALSVLVVALYVALGTAVFRATERWPLADGCYFSFSSLATVGFGDLRPGRYASTVSARAEDAALGVCCLYILVGIVVVAMCFNLVREDAGAAVRGAAALCAPGAGRRAVHSAEAPRDEKPAPAS